MLKHNVSMSMPVGINRPLILFDEENKPITYYLRNSSMERGPRHSVGDLVINDVDHICTYTPFDITYPEDRTGIHRYVDNIGHYWSGWKVSAYHEIKGYDIGNSIDDDAIITPASSTFAYTDILKVYKDACVHRWVCDGQKVIITVLIPKDGHLEPFYSFDMDILGLDSISPNGVDCKVQVAFRNFRGISHDDIITTRDGRIMDQHIAVSAATSAQVMGARDKIHKVITRIIGDKSQENPEALLDAARMKALDYYDECATNSLEGLSDIISAVAILKSPTKGFSELGKDLSDSYVRKLFKPSNVDKGKSLLRRGAEVYASASMTYDWTLAPIPEDTVNIMGGIVNYLSKAVKTDYNKCSNTVSHSYNIIVDGFSVDVEAKAVSTIYTRNMEKDFLASVGLDPTFSNLWETLPLSFVVDMVLPMGDAISVADAGVFFDSSRFKDAFLGECTSIKLDITIKNGAIPIKGTYYTRKFNERLLFGTPYQKSSINWSTFLETLFKLKV